MASLSLVALALLTTVSAFQNTSPLFFASTVPGILPPGQGAYERFLTSSPAVAGITDLEHQLSFLHLPDCDVPSAKDNYIIVHQAGVSAADFQNARSAPHLARWVGGDAEEIQTRAAIPDVVGAWDTADPDWLQNRIRKWRCGGTKVELHGAGDLTVDASSPYPHIYTITFPAVALSALPNHDAKLASFIHNFEGEDWTLIYTTTPRDSAIETEDLVRETYEYASDEFHEDRSQELKRDVTGHPEEKGEYLEGGLFEKYMFFTPGIFMGFIAIAPLFAVLYVGLSAISGLEVSYFAFSREMGPAGQKKL